MSINVGTCFSFVTHTEVLMVTVMSSSQGGLINYWPVVFGNFLIPYYKKTLQKLKRPHSNMLICCSRNNSYYHVVNSFVA